MRNPFRVVVCGACAAFLGGSSLAHAETPVTAEPPSAPRAVVVPAERTTVGPNAALISSGFITFGVPYVISVIVASQSEHPGDKSLFVPVAGPFVDLTHRGSCDGVSEPTCATETGYKVLLVADGLLQTVGAVEMVAGILIPERRTVLVSERPVVHVAPATMGPGGYGLSAAGRF